jgi:hypothetical protein
MNPTVLCPSCKVLPRIRRGYHHRSHTWTAECRNDINCPTWPITSDHPTRDAAVRAWNRGDAFKQTSDT